MKPLVSVVIPTFNRACYLSDAIESVLRQTWTNLELIVIDDGSSDETRELVSRYGEKIQYFYQSNSGLAVARNRGLELARGEFILFLDDDDVLLETLIEKEVFWLEQNPDAAFVYSGVYFVDEQLRIFEKRIPLDDETPDFARLFKGPNIVPTPGCALVRTAIAREYGGFAKELLGSEDYDFWLRISRKYRFDYVGEILLKYRYHQRNKLSDDLDARLRNHLEIFRKPSIVEGLSALKRWERLANVYYGIARLYYDKGDYRKAASLFGISVLRCPWLGLYHWPREIQRYRFSFVYRFLKVYYVFVKCCWLGMVTKKGGV